MITSFKGCWEKDDVAQIVDFKLKSDCNSSLIVVIKINNNIETCSKNAFVVITYKDYYTSNLLRNESKQESKSE